MHKALACTVLGAAATGAIAQTGVTVYGIVDAGVNHVSGLRGGSMTSLASGVMDGSRLGFRGNEDLGGGWRALFTIEHRMEADTGGFSNRPASGSQVPDRLRGSALLPGAPAALQGVADGVAASFGSAIGVNLAGNFWDRQAYVGLVTPAGAVLAGRQYTPAYEVSATFDTLGTQSSLAAGQVATFPPSIDIRVSNAVAYRAQKGAFSGSAMVAAGEGQPTTGRFLGAMGMYKTDLVSAGLGYNTRENERGDKSLTTVVLGASGRVGPGWVHGLYSRVHDDNPSGLSGITAQLTPAVGAPAAALVQSAFVRALRQDANVWHGGYKFVSGVNTVYLAYTRWNDRTAADADVASFGVAYTYALSKRTDLNFVLARFDNRNLAQAAPGGAGFLGGVTSSAGTDSNNVALALRHRF